MLSKDKLTAAELRGKGAEPRAKRFKLSDGEGLYLEVNPKGAKYWRQNYRYNNKQKTLAHGVYPNVTLAEARTAKSEAKRLLREGIDPASDRKFNKQKLENTFGVIATEWFAANSVNWTEGHSKKVWRYIERDIFPDFENVPIDKITTPQLLGVLRKVEEKGTLDVLSRLRQRCENIFNYALVTGRASQNPAAPLKKGVFQTRKVRHQKALSEQELPGFMQALRNDNGHPVTKLAMEMMVHIFIRTKELRFARWKDFDLDKRIWRIPGESMKMDQEHIVPLTDRVLEILEEIRIYNGNREFVFASSNKPRQPLSDNALLTVVRRLGYKGRTTVHGFRSTASTILNEKGYNPDAIERQLAHVEGNKVRAAYNRGEYIQERTEMMAVWSEYLVSLVNGAAPISKPCGNDLQ